MRVTRSAITLLLVLRSSSIAQGNVEEGIADFQQGRYSAALRQLEGTHDEKGRAFYGLSLAATGNCKAALPELTKTRDTNAVLHRLTGIAAVKCYAALGDDAAAYGLLQQMQKRYPTDPDLLYTGARLHMKSFNDSTLAMFQRTPASFRVHQLSAEIFEIQNRFADAVTEYRKAIELNAKAPDLHFRLGRAILLQSHEKASLDQAAEEFRAELKLSPEDSASEFQLGQIALVRGDSAEAKTCFKRALSLAPNFIAALVSMGKLATREKDLAGAIGFLSQAVQLQPDNETAHYALMTAYRDSGKMKEAKGEKVILDRLQKPPEGEFSDFLKKLGEKPLTQ